MQPMNPRGPPPPCKFGPNCKNLAQGTCRFSHSNTMQGPNNPNMNPNINPKFGGQRGPNYPPQNFGTNQPNMYQGGGGSGWGNQPGNYGKTYH